MSTTLSHARSGVSGSQTFNQLTADQVAFYHEHGYLRIPAMFTPTETDGLSDDLDWMIDQWATKDQGWTGPWRRTSKDMAAATMASDAAT